MDINEPVDFGMHVYNVKDSQHLCTLDNVFDTVACCADSDTAKPWDGSDDIPLLTKKNIPGASLNGKDPSESNVAQLKRWLNCQDAPVSGLN